MMQDNCCYKYKLIAGYISQARILERVAISLLWGIFLTQELHPVSPALADGFFTTELPEWP